MEIIVTQDSPASSAMLLPLRTHGHVSGPPRLEASCGLGDKGTDSVVGFALVRCGMRPRVNRGWGRVIRTGPDIIVQFE